MFELRFSFACQRGPKISFAKWQIHYTAEHLRKDFVLLKGRAAPPYETGLFGIIREIKEPPYYQDMPAYEKKRRYNAIGVLPHRIRLG